MLPAPNRLEPVVPAPNNPPEGALPPAAAPKLKKGLAGSLPPDTLVFVPNVVLPELVPNPAKPLNPPVVLLAFIRLENVGCFSGSEVSFSETGLFMLEKIDTGDSVALENREPDSGSLRPNSEGVVDSTGLPNNVGNDESDGFWANMEGTESDGLPNKEVLVASVFAGFEASEAVEPNLKLGARLDSCEAAELLKLSFGSSVLAGDLPKTAKIY